MRATKLGSLLLALGVLIGLAAGAGLLVGFQPARLPAALLNIAAYKLTFLAAFGLLAAGAVFRRYGRQAAEREGPPRAAPSPPGLGEGHSVRGPGGASAAAREPAGRETARRDSPRSPPG
jgi:hypothetical protein